MTSRQFPLLSLTTQICIFRTINHTVRQQINCSCVKKKVAMSYYELIQLSHIQKIEIKSFIHKKKK